MKNIKYLILAICMLSFWSCKPEKFEPITTDINVVKQMQGTWSLTSVVQVDENALKYSFPYKQLDITNTYPFKDAVLTLVEDAQGNPTTFSIVHGNSPKILDINSGTWSLDDPQTPKTITLKNGTAQSQISITSYAGLKFGKLNIQRVKMLNGKPVLTYQYEFTKK